ncbi:Lipoprotein-releasing system ATP-binding protein LolD [Mesomycoplasma hyopneumoniae]|uniref:Lipoprotein-releasing system ATP-binding protein LolD n=1 Tax=Mesomycoplasma hyopneumoniae TaxID=2099 RepID=A0A223MB82_MESHO|nr:Lipoprotein-releasing system ATP-binding protein LolD [Mesomycoplasma hyopneumoniae]
MYNIFSKTKKVEKQNQALAIIKDTNQANLTKKQLKLIRWANDNPRVKIGNIDKTNSPGAIIDFKNVAKYYLFGSVVTKVFADINFSIAAGDFAILSGKSGSGKSTILNLMSGLDRATEGKLSLIQSILPILKMENLPNLGAKMSPLFFSLITFWEILTVMIMSKLAPIFKRINQKCLILSNFLPNLNLMISSSNSHRRCLGATTKNLDSPCSC